MMKMREEREMEVKKNKRGVKAWLEFFDKFWLMIDGRLNPRNDVMIILIWETGRESDELFLPSERSSWQTEWSEKRRSRTEWDWWFRSNDQRGGENRIGCSPPVHLPVEHWISTSIISSKEEISKFHPQKRVEMMFMHEPSRISLLFIVLNLCKFPI